VDAFREKLASVALDYFIEGVEEPPLEVDAEVSLADLTPRAVRELDRLGPYGAEHRRPVFAASRLELVEEPKKFGGGDRHLSLRVKQNNKVLRAVAFGRAEWAEEIIAAGDGPLSLCFQPQMNEFRGFETVELHLVDWKTAEHGAMTPAATA
jgi:single-stranded-DNA-specific exonuclease